MSLLSVYLSVRSEVGTCTEGFSTEITAIRFLPSVRVHVCLQDRLVSEGLPTLATLNWFLYNMNPHVFPP